MSFPKRVSERLASGIKKFQPILNSAKTRDLNESDTVILVTDILTYVFGYDKYSEITSELSIRNTFCDLAIKLDEEVQFLIEVKSIGIELKDPHIKQAVDYAANQGIEWVILTNGEYWKVYKVIFGKPINQDLVIEIKFCELNHKNNLDLENLYLLAKEGWGKSAIKNYHTQRQALSRFYLAALLLSDPVLEIVRRELRRLTPDVKITCDEIKSVMFQEVLKREVLDGDKAKEAAKKISRVQSKHTRKKSPESQGVTNVLSDEGEMQQPEEVLQTEPLA